MNYLHDIYILASVKRYSTSFTIHKESVAEHGFFVAAIVLQLHSEYQFNLGKALKIAIAHDLPEIYLNDASHQLKKDFPEIKEAFDICERRVTEQLPKAAREGAVLYDENDCVESVIVHLADAIQCTQYAMVEVGLGNKGYMLQVLWNSEDRVKYLREALKDYERHTGSD